MHSGVEAGVGFARAGRIGRAASDPESRDFPCSVLAEDVAFENEKSVLLTDTFRFGLDAEGLLYREGGYPPAAFANLVAVAEGRDEKADRRHEPQDDQEDHRQVGDDGERGFGAGNVVHQRISFRALMMFQIITGRTMIMMTKATAVARPSSRNMKSIM